jgi:hypothetical protein
VDYENISMNDDGEEIEVFRCKDDEALGNNGPWNKSCLMTDSELPPVYLVDINEVMAQEKIANDATIFERGTCRRSGRGPGSLCTTQAGRAEAFAS